MKNFIKDSKHYIIKNNLGDNYCIIVYVSIMENRNVYLIYKTIDDFENRIEKDIDDIDDIFNIDFELRIFN